MVCGEGVVGEKGGLGGANGEGVALGGSDSGRRRGVLAESELARGIGNERGAVTFPDMVAIVMEKPARGDLPDLFANS